MLHESPTATVTTGMVRVSTALTPTMHAWVQLEARELGISISTFIRLKVAAARKEEVKVQADE